MNTRKKGNIAEDRACSYLKEKGYRIIERNFYTKFGEIDIIAYKDGVFHFIEVKSGKTFEPIFNITPAKLKRIINSAQYYIKINGIDSAFCIDAVVVKDGIEHFVNISF
ncbi:YraN family protein [Nautilia sp. PV-1]|uniref:YraN family protein n=1 Tax=Nautilia sp. PV-1 TaxID=2579250 RepID=UPI000FD79B96|nr:YraN family protein [Nautilia sp. PV-1]AZV45956.1 YraN family protein [Nautilia sp. PV-1]